MSRRSLRARLVRLESVIGAAPKPWLVLMPGEEEPDPVPERFAGVVKVGVFDGRRPKEAVAP